MRTYFACLLIGIFFKTALLAQPGNYSFLHYTTDQGLSNDHVRTICKDDQGFLWIGTVNGLNRFDGTSFKVFRNDHNSENGLPHNHVLHITPAPDGKLWISTDGGLCILDPLWQEFTNIPLPENADSIRNDGISKVVFDSEGTAWTTGANGIYKIHPETFQHEFIKTEPGYLGDHDTWIDDKDRIWMLAGNKIRRFDTRTRELKTFQGLTPGESLEQAGPLSIVEDFTGDIWSGTWFNGIWKYDPIRDDFFLYFNDGETLCARLLPDASAPGKLFFWVGGGETGLGFYRPDQQQFQNFRIDSRDPFTHNNYIATCFFKDPSNGDVWIGTEIGLEHYAPAALRFGRALLPVEKDMNQFSLVSGVVQDQTDPTGDTYYVAVWGNGVYKWGKENNTFQRFTPENSPLHTNGVFSILQDQQGYIWVTGALGVSRLDPTSGQWKVYTHFYKQLKANTNVLCSYADKKGNIWFGMNGEGLYRYDPESDQIVQALFNDSLLDSKGWFTILQISEDIQGRLWLAAFTSGAIRYDPATGAAKQFTYSGQTYPEVCSGIVGGSNGKVYAQFYDALLELDQNGRMLRRFTQQNGLETSRIYYLVEDKEGLIWMNSEFLLHRFDPRNGTFTYYGKPDGLFSNTITDGLSITPAGEIFVGFQNSFNYFFPKRLRRNITPPPVAITAVKVMNKVREPGVRTTLTFEVGFFFPKIKQIHRDTFLTLRPGEEFFSVEFAALNFNQPERNRYAYRLDGFDQDWIFTERPIATYTNLDGGMYTLRLKAANNDGVWNEEGTILRIRVIPPLIKRWYFKLALILLALALLFGIWRYQQLQHRRLEAFREGLARDLHDEMGSTLSSIRFFSEFASQKVVNGDAKEASPILQRISQSASDLSESMQDIIWAMKTKNDQLEDLAARMTEFGLRLLEARKVRFKIHVSENFSGKQLTPEQRRNVYLIFKEAVNNAAKYADATEVELFLAMKKGLFFMKITDNGKGFDVVDSSMDAGSRSSGGNGLQNMRKRAEEIKGRVEVVSQVGKGTSVELRVRV